MSGDGDGFAVIKASDMRKLVQDLAMAEATIKALQEENKFLKEEMEARCTTCKAMTEKTLHPFVPP